MFPKYISRMMVAVLFSLIIFGAVYAVAAGNSIAGSHLDEISTALTVNRKKPAACTMNLTRLVVCTGGNCDGTGQNELILGTSNGERIRGRGGSDCILGGDGDDNIIGNNGGDICIGGPGTDTFSLCETVIDP
jgi:Ca2+-binding RTX toxin-like protein